MQTSEASPALHGSRSEYRLNGQQTKSALRLLVGSRELNNAPANRIKSGCAVLIILRWPNAAGARDCYIFDSLASFHGRVAQLRAVTRVLVVSNIRTAFSGCIDDELACRLSQEIPARGQNLLVFTHPRDARSRAAEYESCRSSRTDVGVASHLRTEPLGNVGAEVETLHCPDILHDETEVLEAIAADETGQDINAAQ